LAGKKEPKSMIRKILTLAKMQTTHLDRVLNGKNTRDVLEDDRWPVNHITPRLVQKSSTNGTKQTASIRSVMSNDIGKSRNYIWD
jgi:hypothetical protein